MNGCLPTSVSSQILFFSECEFRTIHLSMLNLITSAYQDMIFVTWYINYPFQLWLSKKSDLCSRSSHSSNVVWERFGTEYISLSLEMILEGYWCTNKHSLDI